MRCTTAGTLPKKRSLLFFYPTPPNYIKKRKDIDMKTSFKRLGAILMAVAILFSFTVAADAATVPTATIDTGRTGSIDIYKYDLTRANTDDAAAAMIDSYVSTGVRDTALEAVLASVHWAASLTLTKSCHALS